MSDKSEVKPWEHGQGGDVWSREGESKGLYIIYHADNRVNFRDEEALVLTLYAPVMWDLIQKLAVFQEGEDVHELTVVADSVVRDMKMKGAKSDDVG